jgi:hypothetical protein
MQSDLIHVTVTANGSGTSLPQSEESQTSSKPGEQTVLQENHGDEESSLVASEPSEREESKQTSSSPPETSKNKEKTETSVLKQSDRVYVTPSGSRYHVSATCGGKNATDVSLQEAVDQGKTPCKRCCKEK